jgi:hypothetical protein
MRLHIGMFIAVALSACGGSQHSGSLELSLTAGCPANGCVAQGEGPKRLQASQKALSEFNLDVVKTELEAAQASGPLDHPSYVSLWEQKGIAAAYVEDEKTASDAFEMLLALDPRHLLSYTLSPKATFVFEKVRAQDRTEPSIDVTWPRDLKVGSHVPIEIDVVADPRSFLTSAKLFVRERGGSDWKAADITISAGRTTKITLPGIDKKAASSLELYLQAFDSKGNTVLTWADPKRPREIPMRYEPPTPWTRKWWVWAIAGSVVAASTGAVVYAASVQGPDRVNGSVVVK